tara:strand:- start:878 stop:1321 length:444 start_codon:yes stop_codon:yes gene_type:complete
MLFLTIDPKDDHYWKVHPTYNKAYKNGDVGLDIPMQRSVIVPAGARSFKINLDFKATPTQGYMLVPRSSISKTSVRLSNSIGIIDKKYRGDVMVVLDNLGETDVLFQEGCCYFQIVAFGGNLPTYQIDNVDNDTSRGSGGFGSTGAN